MACQLSREALQSAVRMYCRSALSARADRHCQPARIGRVLVNTGAKRGGMSSPRQPVSLSCVLCSVISLRTHFSNRDRCYETNTLT